MNPIFTCISGGIISQTARPQLADLNFLSWLVLSLIVIHWRGNILLFRQRTFKWKLMLHLGVMPQNRHVMWCCLLKNCTLMGYMPSYRFIIYINLHTHCRSILSVLIRSNIEFLNGSKPVDNDVWSWKWRLSIISSDTDILSGQYKTLFNRTDWFTRYIY